MSPIKTTLLPRCNGGEFLFSDPLTTGNNPSLWTIHRKTLTRVSREIILQLNVAPVVRSVYQRWWCFWNVFSGESHCWQFMSQLFVSLLEAEISETNISGPGQRNKIHLDATESAPSAEVATKKILPCVLIPFKSGPLSLRRHSFSLSCFEKSLRFLQTYCAIL